MTRTESNHIYIKGYWYPVEWSLIQAVGNYDFHFKFFAGNIWSFFQRKFTKPNAGVSMRMHAREHKGILWPVKSGSILIGNLLSRNPPVCDTKSFLSSPYRYRWWRKNLILVLLATVCYITPKKINFMLRTIFLGIQEMLYLQDLHFNITTQQGCDSKITPMKRYICTSAQVLWDFTVYH